MFSASLEIVLTIAYREAVSRRHAYLTLEHLLYALAHDPDGERILKACGADLPKLRRELHEYLEQSLEAAAPRPRARARTDRGVSAACCRPRCCTCRARRSRKSNAGDILAAILQQPKSHAARLLEAQGITRLDVLEFISHGITKTPEADGAGRRQRPEAPARRRARKAAARRAIRCRPTA